MNEGAELFCANKATNKATKYCEFEWFFIDDLSRALGINFDQIQVSERSERSERALMKTSILAINPTKWLQTTPHPHPHPPLPQLN